MLIDAHTHLNIAGSDAQGKYNLFANWKEHVKEFQEVGGKILINAGAREDYNEKGILIAREAMTLFPDLIVKTTVGIHPEDTPHDDTTQNPPSPPLRKGIVQLERLYLDNKEHIVAIWECGIDLHGNTHPPLEQQQHLFTLQAELARKLWLPLMVHSREGFDATMKVLKEFSDLKIYFHCRGYGPEEVEQVNELLPQVWFGFTNILTYPNAGKTRDSLLAMKPEQIVLETDAPFLPPQMFRGQVNTPAYVAYVYEKVAELLEMQQEELGALVEKNVRVFFGI